MSNTMNSPKTSKPDRDLERIKGTVKKESDAAKEQLSGAATHIREEASKIAEKAKDVVSERADESKETVASSMTDFAAAVRRASDELGQRDQSMAANLVREVASGLEDASRTIRGRSLGDLTRSVSDFARRQPAAFLLGATVAGIALGRFVKATDERDDNSSPALAEAGARPTMPTSGTSSGMTSSRITTPHRGDYRDR